MRTHGAFGVSGSWPMVGTYVKAAFVICCSLLGGDKTAQLDSALKVDEAGSIYPRRNNIQKAEREADHDRVEALWATILSDTGGCALFSRQGFNYGTTEPRRSSALRDSRQRQPLTTGAVTTVVRVKCLARRSRRFDRARFLDSPLERIHDRTRQPVLLPPDEKATECPTTHSIGIRRQFAGRRYSCW